MLKEDHQTEPTALPTPALSSLGSTPLKTHQTQRSTWTRPLTAGTTHPGSTAGNSYARAQAGDTPPQTTYSTPPTMQGLKGTSTPN